MHMHVFKFSGKFELKGHWSNRDSDFNGFFVKWKDDNVVTGYVEELADLSSDPKYLKGLYTDEGLVFLQKYTDSDFTIVYVFPKTKEQGVWFQLGNEYCQFHWNRNIDGHATIDIQEITDQYKKLSIAQKVASISESEKTVRKSIVNNVAFLEDFLDPTSEWYPKGW